MKKLKRLQEIHQKEVLGITEACLFLEVSEYILSTKMVTRYPYINRLNRDGDFQRCFLKSDLQQAYMESNN